MTGYPWTAWLWWIGGAALGLLGLWLLYWSLLHDRSKGHRRCPKCWYNMSGTDSLTCSECGRTAKREERLYKTRRRWRWAITATLIGFLAGGSTLTPKIQRDGWVSTVPTRGLIWLLPWTGETPGQVHQVLVTRARADELSPADWNALFDRIVKGDSAAKPTTASWEQKYYAIFQQTYLIFDFRDHPGREASQKLYDLPPQYSLAVRPRWPEGLPLVVHGTYRTWWPIPNAFAMHVQPRTGGQQAINLFGGAGGHTTIEFTELTQPLDSTIIFDVRLFQRRWINDQSEWREIGTDVIEVRVTIGGSINDCISSLESMPIKSLLQTGLQATAFRSEDQNLFVVELVPFATRSSLCAGLGFGFRGEFLLDDEVIASTTYWWDGGQSGFKYLGFNNPYEGDFERLRLMRAEENWKLRLRADPTIAIRVPNVDQYWNGTITLPIAIRDLDLDE